MLVCQTEQVHLFYSNPDNFLLVFDKNNQKY